MVKDTPRQDVLPRLETGLLAPSLSSARGTLFPQPSLVPAGGGEALLMDERFGYGWRLVHDAALPVPALTRDLTAIALGPSGWLETDGVVSAWMRRHECHAALIRPDHYVYGVAATTPDLHELLAQRRKALT